MIERPKYLNQLIESKENGFPKVITGIRRCGKSSLLKDIYYEYLLSIGISKKNIVIIELDSIENTKYHDPFELNDYILNQCKDDSMHYVFIDEIQLVDTLINPIYTNGKHISSARYKEISDFKDGLASVKREDGKYNVIDRSGNPILDKWYGYLNVLKNGIIKIYDDSNLKYLFYYFDTKSKEIISST